MDKHKEPPKDVLADNPPSPVDDSVNWNNNLGSTIGAFCQAVVQADGQSKDAYVARLLNLLKVPNADFVADASLIGQKNPLQLRIDTPIISISKTDPILIDTATISLDMAVSSSTQDLTQSSAKAEGSGSASVGWGPFKAQISVSAAMSTSAEHKRQSDYRSRTQCEVKMSQGQPAEGLSLIMESVYKFISTACRINEQIVEAQVGQIVQDAQANSKPVPPEPAPKG